MAGHSITDFIVVNYRPQDKDDCIHFLTHVDAGVQHLCEVVSPTAKCVYTSKFNAWYLKTYLGADPKVIVGMECDRSFKIEVQGKTFLFALVDSHYNTGSVMLILRGGFGTILYTGYFCYYPGMLESPILQAIINRKALTKLYLDTTYLEQVTGFRSMADNTERIVYLIRNSVPKKIYIYLGGMGLENVLIDIAKSINELIMLDSKTMMLMEQLKMNHLFTRNQSGVRIFVTSNLVTKRPQAKPEEFELIALERIKSPFPAYSTYSFTNNKHTFKFYCHPTHAECCTIINTFMPESTIPIGVNNFNNKIIYNTNFTLSDKTSEFSPGDQNFFPKTEMAGKSTRLQQSQAISHNICFDQNELIGYDNHKLCTTNNDRSLISEVTGSIRTESLPTTHFDPLNGLTIHQGGTKKMKYIKNSIKFEVLKEDKTPDSAIEQSRSSEICDSFKVDGLFSLTIDHRNTKTFNINQSEMGKTSSICEKTDISSSCSKPESLFSRKEEQVNLKVRNVEEINNSLATSDSSHSSKPITFKNLDNIHKNVLPKDNSVQLGAHFIEAERNSHNQLFKTGRSVLKNTGGEASVGIINKYSETRSENGINFSNLRNKSQPQGAMNVNIDFNKLSQIKRTFSLKRKQCVPVSVSKKNLMESGIFAKADINKKLNKSSFTENVNTSVELVKVQSQGENCSTNKSSLVLKKDSVSNQPLVSADVSSVLVEQCQTFKKIAKICSIDRNLESTVPNICIGKSTNLGNKKTHHDSTGKPVVIINNTMQLPKTVVMKPLLLSTGSKNARETIGITESQQDSQVSVKENKLTEEQEYPYGTSKHINESQDSSALHPYKTAKTVFGTLCISNLSKTIKKPLLVLQKSFTDNNFRKVSSVTCNISTDENFQNSKVYLPASKESIINETDVNNSLCPLNVNCNKNLAPDSSSTVITYSLDDYLCNGDHKENGNDYDYKNCVNKETASKSNNEISRMNVNGNEQFQTAARIRIFKRPLKTQNKNFTNKMVGFSELASNKQMIPQEVTEIPTEVHIMDSNTTNLDRNVINRPIELNQFGELDVKEQNGNGIKEETMDYFNVEVDDTSSLIVDSVKIEHKSVDKMFPQKSKKNDIKGQLIKMENVNIVSSKPEDRQKSEAYIEYSSEDEDCEIDLCQTKNFSSQVINDIIGVDFTSPSVIKVCYYEDDESQTEVITGHKDNGIADESMQNQSLDSNVSGNSYQYEQNMATTSQLPNISSRHLGKGEDSVNKQVKDCSLFVSEGKTEQRRRCHRHTKLPTLLSESYVLDKISKSVNRNKKQINAESPSNRKSKPNLRCVDKNMEIRALLLTGKDKIHSSNSKCKPNPYVLLERNYLKSARYTYSIKRHCFIPYSNAPKFWGTFIRRNYNKGIQNR